MKRNKKEKVIICKNGLTIVLNNNNYIKSFNNDIYYFRAIKGFNKKPSVRGVFISPHGEVMGYKSHSELARDKNKHIVHTNNNYKSLNTLKGHLKIGAHFFKDGIASKLKVLCGGYIIK